MNFPKRIWRYFFPPKYPDLGDYFDPPPSLDIPMNNDQVKQLVDLGRVWLTDEQWDQIKEHVGP